MTTGEQPVTPLGEKSTFDWKFVVLLVGLAFEAGQSLIRLSALEKSTEKQEQRDQKQDERLGAQELGAAGLSAQLANLNSTVSKMDGKIDRLLEARTNSAVYRQPRGPTP